jgi:integrase
LSECYYGKCPAPDGKPRRVKLCTDKTASKQILAKRLTDASLRAVGLADPFEASHKRPLTEHVEDYRRHLLAKGDTEKHARQTARYVTAVLTSYKAVFIPDLSASAVAEFLHGLRLDPGRPDLPPGQETFTKREVLALFGVHPNGFALLLRRAGLHGTAIGNGKARRYPRATVEALLDRCCRGQGASTSNVYLTAIRGFTRWLAKDRRTGSDPLSVLSRLNANADARRQRRPLAEPELRELLNAAAESDAVFRGLTEWDRRMVYAVGMTTGFRAGELASLEPGSFALDDEPPTATVQAAYAKNRRTSVQPLTPTWRRPCTVIAATGPPASRSGPAAGPTMPPTCCASTWKRPTSPARTLRGACATSTRCGTATSSCCSGAAFTRRLRRNWPGTPTSA